MTTEKMLSESESMDVITKMIATAHREFKDDSFYYLIWGWFVFIASTLNYILLSIGYEMSFLPWVILMPLGGILTGIYSWKFERHQKVQTYIDEVMKYVLISFFISLTTVLVFGAKLGLNAYPIVMLVYGNLLFVSGGAIRFKPLIYGGVINWALGIAAFFVPFDIQLLLLSLAVLLGYIIPGHMMKSKFRKQSAATSVI